MIDIVEPKESTETTFRVVDAEDFVEARDKTCPKCDGSGRIAEDVTYWNGAKRTRACPVCTS